MNLSADLAEATRLTRAGRLAEATDLIRSALGRGDAPSAPPAAARRPLPSASTAGRRWPILDVDPATGRLGDDVYPSANPPHFAGGRITTRLGDDVCPSANPPADLPETLRGLFRGAGAGPGFGGEARAVPATPAGARFETRAHAGAAGGREYKLYIPAARPPGPAPLLLMLHGCTQSPDDFAAGTRMNELAEAHGMLVAYPSQPASANAQRCWNWFAPGDQRRGAGEPAILAGLAREVLRLEAGDPGRVFVAGLSAGGAAAAILGRAYPELFAAVGVHSGLACGAARDIPSAFAAMKGGGDSARADGPPVRTIVFHADRDATVHPVNGERVAEQAAGGAGPALRREVSSGEAGGGGHRWTRTRHLDAAGRAALEQWVVHGGGHAWSGGSPAGTYTDPRGPDASREMLRFFLET